MDDTPCKEPGAIDDTLAEAISCITTKVKWMISIWQDVIWIEKKRAEIKLLKKSMNMWFLCFWGFIMAVGNQIIQKNIKKLLSGYFLAYPPKMHYSAPQCSAMYCSVNAWIIHSRWVKYDPQWPRMTDYSPGWHTRGQGGTRGPRGAPGGASGVQATPGAKKSDKTVK